VPILDVEVVGTGWPSSSAHVPFEPGARGRIAFGGELPE
jgi:hypothetical protein